MRVWRAMGPSPILVLVLFTLCWHGSRGASSVSATANSTSAGAPAHAIGNATAPRPVYYEKLTGSEVVWQKPALSVPIKGILLLAHGCGQSATDFFPTSPACPNCAGLPEEANITRIALAHGYAVVAISSLDRAHKCWRVIGQSRGEESPDITQVRQVLKSWLKRESLTTSPVYAMGISSGGTLVMALAKSVPLAGICAQVSALPVPVLRRLMARMPEGRGYPPTMFVHMPRDEVYARIVARNHAVLSSEGVPVRLVAVPPRRVTQQLLLSKLPDLGSAAAADLVHALRGNSIIDQEGFVLNDPQQEREAWQQVVRNALPSASDEGLAPGLPLSDVEIAAALKASARADMVGKVLALAYGKHEAVSEATVDMLRFWEESQRTAAQRRLQLQQPALHPGRLENQ